MKEYIAPNFGVSFVDSVEVNPRDVNYSLGLDESNRGSQAGGRDGGTEFPGGKWVIHTHTALALRLLGGLQTGEMRGMAGWRGGGIDEGRKGRDGNAIIRRRRKRKCGNTSPPTYYTYNSPTPSPPSHHPTIPPFRSKAPATLIAGDLTPSALAARAAPPVFTLLLLPHSLRGEGEIDVPPYMPSAMR